MKAQLLIHKKERNSEGHITEIKIWSVAASEHHPYGLKYSFVYIVNGMRVVGYDNERGKGDHRHINGFEHPYKFTTPSQLKSDFDYDVKVWRQGDL